MSQQDVKLRLAPGETKEIQRPGRFIFCKFSDRQVSLIMDQARIEMEAGDKHVSADRFSSFQVQNLDQEREAYLIFVVGDGDFDRMIVQGEISIEPILRNADGTTKPDTRFTLEIDLLPVSGQVTTLSPGAVLAQVDAPYKSAGGVFVRPDGIVAHTVWTNEPDLFFGVAEFDEQLNLIGTVQATYSALDTSTTKAFCWVPLAGYIVVKDNAIVSLASGTTLAANVFDQTGSLANGQLIESLCDDGKGNVIAMNRHGEIVVLSQNGFTLIQSKVLPVYSKGSGIRAAICRDNFSGDYLVQTNNDNGWQRYDSGFELIENLPAKSHYPAIDEGRDIQRNALYVSRDFQSSGIDVLKLVFQEYQTSPVIQAVKPFCGLNNALLKRNDPIVLTAQITATEGPNGIQIEGELIKAALEYYYRTKVPDDYLNHVYGFDVSRDKNGYPFKQLISGNRTFDAANIADNLSTLAPSRVTVILDNELELGANL